MAVEEPFSSQEKDAFAQMLLLASTIDKSQNTKKLTTASPLAQGRKFIAKNQKATTGSYTTNVPCGHQELINFINMEAPSSDMYDRDEEVFNDHHQIKYYAMSLPKLVSDREWRVSIMTKKIDDETIVKVCVPCFIEEKARNVHPDRVRAELRSMYRLTKISDSTTRVEFLRDVTPQTSERPGMARINYDQEN